WRAERLVEHDVAALGAKRDAHCVRENVDAAQHPRARVAAEAYFLGWHCYPPEFFRPALSGLLLRRRGALEHAHDFGLLHHQEFVAVELDLGARPPAEQHAVAGLDLERHDLALLIARARADRDDLALLRFFLGGVGDDDAAGRARLFFHPADHDAIVQWLEFHERSSPSWLAL